MEKKKWCTNGYSPFIKIQTLYNIKEISIKIIDNGIGIPEENYRKRVQTSLWGTPETFAEKLFQYKEQGVSHIILMFPYSEKREQIALFGDQVLPLL